MDNIVYLMAEMNAEQRRKKMKKEAKTIVQTVLSPSEKMVHKMELFEAIVIDTLRMTSTAVTAIESGCTGIYTVKKVEDSLNLKINSPGLLLGGERGGVLIEGFDLGNSPLEYSEQVVRGRRIVMTTTNGTQAIHQVRNAKKVYLACLRNVKEVARRAIGAKRLLVYCAGTAGRLTMEDVLTAGAVIDRLLSLGADVEMDDSSQVALRLYRGAQGNLHEAMKTTKHYQFLHGLGEGPRADLHFCLQEDVCTVVPVMQQDGWFVKA